MRVSYTRSSEAEVLSEFKDRCTERRLDMSHALERFMQNFNQWDLDEVERFITGGALQVSGGGHEPKSQVIPD